MPITDTQIELPTFYGNSDEIAGWFFDDFPLCDDAALHYIFGGHVRRMKAAINGTDLSWAIEGTGMVQGDGVASEYPEGLYCAHCGGELLPSEPDSNGWSEDYSDSEDNKVMRRMFNELHPLKWWYVIVENIGTVINHCLYRAIAQRVFVQYTRKYPKAQCSFWQSGVDDPIVTVEPRR